jgi:hypothetical protein
MTHQDIYDDLAEWQKAMVNREALALCRENRAYLHLEPIVDGDDHDAAVHADEVCYTMRENAKDLVLNDQEFMESITVDAEDRYMTRGDNHAR